MVMCFVFKQKAAYEMRSSDWSSDVCSSDLPTEALIADVLVRKYADHTPFYLQAQALRRQGIAIDRGTMCNWAGRAAAWLGRLTSRMKADLLTGARLFVDETTAKEIGRAHV